MNPSTAVVEHPRIGGAADLPDRAAQALAACADSIGSPPTAKKYQQWRLSLPEDQREQVPSLTSIVPIAYPSWGAARLAAGVDSPDAKPGSHGPHPKWTREDCLAVVARWMEQEGTGSLAAFTVWIDAQRAAGGNVPSVSTIRLRLRMPWSGIVEAAASGN